MSMELLMFYLIEQQYHITYNANGVHSFKFFIYNNNIISVKDAIRLKSIGIKVRDSIHVGIKYHISNDIALFSLFTSNEVTSLPFNIKIDNLKLNNNIHSHMNPLSLINNKTFSNFFLISDNLHHFPAHCKIYINTPEIILNNSINAYKNALLYHNFNNSYMAIDDHLNYYNKSKNIKINNILYFTREPWILRLKGLNNTDIINFYNNFIIDKTSLAKDMHHNNLYYDIHKKWLC